MRGVARIAPLVAAAVLLASHEVAAQSRPAEIRLGAGYNYLWFTESSDSSLALQGSVRFPMSSHLSLEPDVSFAHSAETLGPTGESEATTNSWNVGVNLIVSKTGGRLRPYGGGGGGVFMRRRVFETTIGTGPQARVFRTVTKTNPVISGRALAGLDVVLTESTALFAEFRVNALAVSAGAVGFWYLAGVRVAVP
jgi:hypothetical protein